MAWRGNELTNGTYTVLANRQKDTFVHGFLDVSGRVLIAGNLVLGSGGRVGIGSANPVYTLDVSSVSTQPFRVGIGATNALVVNSVGQVGIGTNNPTVALDVVGNVNISGYLRTTGATNAIPSIIAITTSGNGTWTIPTGVFRCKVTCVGGGGGGQNGLNYKIGRGGGGGGLCIKVFNNLTPGSTASYTVGGGGAGADDANNHYYGANGSNTTFTWSGTTITAYGGKDDGSGGTAANGDINITGGNGNIGSADVRQTVSSTTIFAIAGVSTGGNSPLGYGYGGIHKTYNLSNAVVGENGSGYGGGGSGGYGAANAKGGNGAGGIIIIEY